MSSIELETDFEVSIIPKASNDATGILVADQALLSHPWHFEGHP
jgi:hypothetical protein